MARADTQHDGEASRSARSHWLLRVSAQYSVTVPYTGQETIRVSPSLNRIPDIQEPPIQLVTLRLCPSHDRIVLG